MKAGRLASTLVVASIVLALTAGQAPAGRLTFPGTNGKLAYGLDASASVARMNAAAACSSRSTAARASPRCAQAIHCSGSSSVACLATSTPSSWRSTRRRSSLRYAHGQLFWGSICYDEANLKSLPPLAFRILTKNPVYILVRGYRSILLESKPPDWHSLAWLTVIAAAVFLLGHAWFYKLRKSFADLI